MKLPDVIGFALDDALPEIESLGFVIAEIKTTKPAHTAEPCGTARVVRINDMGDAKLQIVVAYEDYLKGGV